MPVEIAATAPVTVTVVGDGRLGRVLATALRDAGYTVQGPLGRTDPHPDADITLLCVRDAQILDAATAARPHARLIGHVSGATGLDGVDFSLHPLQTFTGTETPDVFRGIGAAIDGRTPEALGVAETLARALGATPYRVQDADRAAYHAASAFASNLILPVLDAAEQIALAAGIPEPRPLLAPLVTRSVENWVCTGASAALSGPIVRGDEATIARQRAAVAGLSELGDLSGLFDELVSAARVLNERGVTEAAAPTQDADDQSAAVSASSPLEARVAADAYAAADVSGSAEVPTSAPSEDPASADVHVAADVPASPLAPASPFAPMSPPTSAATSASRLAPASPTAPAESHPTNTEPRA